MRQRCCRRRAVAVLALLIAAGPGLRPTAGLAAPAAAASPPPLRPAPAPAAAANRSRTVPDRRELLEACEWPDLDGALERFQQILQFRTVSSSRHEGSMLEPGEFDRLGAWFTSTYDESVCAKLQCDKVGAGGRSYLLTWRGSEPSLRPVLAVGHYDVVPVDPETLQDWSHPPFSGALADGHVWGRGAQDAKVGFLGLLEAVAALLAEGYRPKRTLMLALGHDEEVGGASGAAQVAAQLAAQGVELEILWDEGSSVSLDGAAPLTSRPVALVSTAEKRQQGVEVELRAPGGHSSMPPTDSSGVGSRLARLLAAIDARPPPAALVSPTREFIAAAAVLAPAWLAPLLRAGGTLPPVAWLLAQLTTFAGSEAAALVRSTAAATRVSAGVADNVLPQTAAVLISFRLIPGEGPEDALRTVKGWLGRDAAFATATLKQPVAGAAAPVADADGPHFQLLRAAIQAAWRTKADGAPLPVLPMLLPAMTDSRHYAAAGLTPNGVLRWMPGTFSRAGRELLRVHGTNERMSVGDFACGLVTYREALRAFGDYAPAKVGGGSSGRGVPGAASAQQQQQQQQQEEL